MCQKRVVLNAFRFNTQNLRAKIEVYYMLFDLIHIQNQMYNMLFDLIHIQSMVY